MTYTLRTTAAIGSVLALSLGLMFAFATTAFAQESEGDRVDVRNTNEATVVNETGAEAKTGKNYAGGSTGGDGGDGGDAENGGGTQNVNSSGTGSGGNGGDGSEGGTVLTGPASANTSVTNRANFNDTVVDRCACEGEDEGDTIVRNRNNANLINGTFARAKTGYNEADGSTGGDAGDGGSLENDAGDQNVNSSGTGDGGHGGTGDAGGFVQTGRAAVLAETVNVVNRNVTRVRR